MSTIIKNIPIAVTGTFGAITVDNAILEQCAKGFNRDRYRPDVREENRSFTRCGEVLSLRVIGSALHADLLIFGGMTEIVCSDLYPGMEAYVPDGDTTRIMLCGVILHGKQVFEGGVRLRDCDVQPYIKQEYWLRSNTGNDKRVGTEIITTTHIFK
ncbi:hypothetical protein CTR22_002944 [Salmonella enterica subsp. houtenae]|nr:hypothetical protein [Salmonella enterica subsp. houtenae]